MPLFQRKKKQPVGGADPEVNAAEGGLQEEKVDRYASGEEYDILLRYVDDQTKAAKEKQAAANQAKGEDEEGDFTRTWYGKKVKVKSDKDKVAPEEWLKTDMRRGLSDAEAEGRRKDFGFNELTSPTENQFLKFMSYFKGPILYVMELAVILSAGLEDWIDFGVIIAILAMNATVGWYQEKQAGDIVAQLKAGIAMKAYVIRDGKEREIEARDLVIGDIIIIDEGQTIPADARILANYDDKDGTKAKQIMSKLHGHSQGGQHASNPRSPQGNDHNLDQNSGNSSNSSDTNGKETNLHHDQDDIKIHSNQGHDQDHDEEQDPDDKGPSIISVDQSAITGESLAVEKYLGEVAYYTCGVKRGKAIGVVSCSAKQSFVGKTAGLVMGSNEKGHFQIVLGSIGTTLLVLVLFFIFIVWVGGFFRGIGISEPKQNNLLVYALIFFIIGVPVGLPVVTTTTMAVGAAYLARRKCIVQKLTAIEALAGVDVLCTDKTGTLTANKLSLNEPFLSEGVDRDWFMTVAILASSHNVKSLDPIDKVTILTLKDYPGAQENLRSGWKTKKFSPFDPVSKRITAEVSKDGKNYTCAKGAPNAILKLKNFDQDVVEAYRDQAGIFAKKGFRSLGVAVKEEGKDWDLLGIMSMSDPPRSDTAATIAEAQNLGISIKMLTGDAVAIGKELARQLHLGTNIYDSQKLIGGSMGGSDVRDFVEAADGFAEVYPEHKFQVVEMLQQRGRLVAMTGDGVNDAPSLKRADCGIAVEGASDAARSAADVVFLDEGLNSIITSIKVARQIFHRMKAYIVYRIALCIHLEVYLMLSILILNETIRVDLIVFLALFSDVATIAIAYDNAPFARAPVEWQLPKVWIISTIMGLLLAAGTWITRGTMFLEHGGIIQNFGSVQEVLFLEVALTESWVIFITRLSQQQGDAFVMPSWQLVGAVFGVDILASLFVLFGWLSGSGYPEPEFRSGRTSIVTVVRVWCLSFGIVIVVAFAYILLNKINWLDQLGKKNRSHKNTKMENFLTEMQKMALVHEMDSDGHNDYYRFSPSGPKKQKETEDTPDTVKGAKANQDEKHASGVGTPKKSETGRQEKRE